MTAAEIVLWEALRAGKVGGLKFRLQHIVGNFILDFYCVSCKLVVEIDGPIHLQQIEHDTERTRLLGEYGYRVIRFTNDEVLNDLANVVMTIQRTANGK